MTTGYFQPFISYRRAPKGGGLQPRAVESSSGLLTRYSSALFLIHGYNNDQPDASSAFKRFVELQMELGAVRANLIGVYWPGDNWENGLYYMQAIGKVKDLAPRFARDLRAAAVARGYMRVDLIAHSLGCRLAFEVLRELQGNPTPQLVIGRIVVMAAAVPTFYLQQGRPLRLGYNQLQGAKSLYSENDKVLRWAFPLGQALMGEGFFPTALGRKEWNDPDALRPPPLDQRRNIPGTGHSDYWGGSSQNIPSLRYAAREIRAFIDVGALPPRLVSERIITTRQSEGGRDTSIGRTVAVRVV